MILKPLFKRRLDHSECTVFVCLFCFVFVFCCCFLFVCFVCLFFCFFFALFFVLFCFFLFFFCFVFLFLFFLGRGGGVNGKAAGITKANSDFKALHIRLSTS